MHLLPEAIGRPQEGGSVSQLSGYETMGAGIPQVGVHPPGELGRSPSLEPQSSLFPHLSIFLALMDYFP